MAASNRASVIHQYNDRRRKRAESDYYSSERVMTYCYIIFCFTVVAFFFDRMGVFIINDLGLNEPILISPDEIVKVLAQLKDMNMLTRFVDIDEQAPDFKEINSSVSLDLKICVELAMYLEGHREFNYLSTFSGHSATKTSSNFFECQTKKLEKMNLRASCKLSQDKTKKYQPTCTIRKNGR